VSFAPLGISLSTVMRASLSSDLPHLVAHVDLHLEKAPGAGDLLDLDHVPDSDVELLEVLDGHGFAHLRHHASKDPLSAY